MYIIGHIAAILIGLSLGLIGSGGSILTVPVLVYLIGIPPVVATGYSLFIVGLTASTGCISYTMKNLVNYRVAIFFGISSIAGVFISRWYILPSIPSSIFSIGTLLVTKNIFIMILFSILMIAASRSMIESGKKPEDENQQEEIKNFPLLILDGIVVGLLTGFVGVGGGFLIIPALVMLAKMKMKNAIGTSLFIIAINSFIGFSLEWTLNPDIDWKFLFIFTFFAISGIFIGNYFSRFVSGQKLKPIFGWFVLAMGIYIIVKEIYFR